MLFVALVLSGVLLLIANWAATRSKRPGIVIFVSGLALSVFPICGGIVIPAVPLLTLIFCLLLLVPPSRFRPLSMASFMIVFAILSVPAISNERQYAQWRDRFPFESIEERLALHPSKPPTPVPVFDPSRLELAEGEIEEEAKKANDGLRGRARHLRMLHEETVTRFINSPGFGQARLIFSRFSEEALMNGMRDDQLIPQPAIVVGKLRSVDNLKYFPVPDASTIELLHRNCIVDFVHPAGWGYAKDRRHVAGFQSHQFSKVPEPTGTLRVASIELIGWLRGEPIAYVSDHLPAMKELRNAPTRPLDAFEEEGLAKLRRGEDLFTKSENGSVRLLGAIRATKQCIDCHGSQRGDLLGAFSYQLR